MTGCPRPGPLISAAIVTIDSAAIVVWLSPTMIVRRAIGSCTLRRVCQLVEPIEFAASTLVGDTVRRPWAAMRTKRRQGEDERHDHRRRGAPMPNTSASGAR